MGDLERRTILLRADSIRPEPIEWVWGGYLARGKKTVLGGRPGGGKTTLALAMAATVTSGGPWPDGSTATAADVVMWSGEDDASDTLVPRLIAMGADLTRMHFVGPVTRPVKAGKYEVTPFDPASDIDALAESMARVSDVQLLIVDPIVMAIAGDSHKNAETRRGLQPLVELAQHSRCALLGITHFSKGTAGRDPLDRISGSLAFGAMARVVMVAAQEQAEDGSEGRRLLLRAKSNIGPDTGGFAYDLHQEDLPGYPGVIASSVRWGAAVEGTARELLAEAEQQDEHRGAANDAAAFLRDALADGARPCKEVFSDGDSAGFSRDQLKRAMRKIGCETRKIGHRGAWSWSLPKGCTKTTTENPAPFAPFTPLAPFKGSKESKEGKESMNVSGGKALPLANHGLDHDELDRQFYGTALG